MREWSLIMACRLAVIGGSLGGVTFHYLTGQSWGSSLRVAVTGALGMTIAYAIGSTVG